MSKKKLIVILLIVVLVVVVFLFKKKKTVKADEGYEFTEVLKGDLEAVISSTGTLNPVTSVQVGTQVSGRIAEIYVDFNSRVKKGQLLAQLDTSFLQMSLTEAEAAFERSKVQLEQADLEYKRIAYLFKESIKTKNDLDQAEINLKVARANFKTAESNLKKAKINLSYASIYSPVDGIVISRNVDVGQTVAASLSAPTLFVIAEDLRKMQIITSVDESDIGQIKEGLKVRFSVQAFPERKYSGQVSQIRLQPNVNQNVVTYSVVVDVHNDDLTLLPGMTATVDFILGEARDVFMVANQALRLRPDEKMVAILQKKFQSMRSGKERSSQNEKSPESNSRTGMMRMNPFAMGSGSNQSGPRKFALLWFQNEKGELDFIPVRIGLSDGKNTEIISDKLKVGMKVIKSIPQSANFPRMIRMF